MLCGQPYIVSGNSAKLLVLNVGAVLICIVGGPHEDLLSLHGDIVENEAQVGYFAIRIPCQPSADYIEALLNVCTCKFIKWVLTVVTRVQQLSAFCINLIT